MCRERLSDEEGGACMRLCVSLFSGSVLLRTQLHYELAMCELSADFLVKASEQLTFGLALDYGRVEKEVEDVLAGKVTAAHTFSVRDHMPCSVQFAEVVQVSGVLLLAGGGLLTLWLWLLLLGRRCAGRSRTFLAAASGSVHGAATSPPAAAVQLVPGARWSAGRRHVAVPASDGR